MQRNKRITYLLDFDSTFIQSEGLDILAGISLEHNPQKVKIIQQIKELTQKGMDGEMPLATSLSKRIALLEANKKNIKKAASILSKKITPSILRNKQFFQQHKKDIFIISGGFVELIMPVVEKLGIDKKQVFANTFVYDINGKIIGLDQSNPLSQNKGKARIVKDLNLSNDVYIIGDGYTDYELKKLGLAKKFIAFTENIQREVVTQHADEIAPTFDDFLFVNRLPRSTSYPKNRIRVFLFTDIPQEQKSIFQNEGYEIVYGTNNTIFQASSIVCASTEAFEKNKLLRNTSKALAIGLYDQHTTVPQDINKYESAAFAGKNIAQKIIKFINTGSTSQSINIPNLNLPQYKNSHRLLHIHKNVPGILSRINKILADHSINILGQYLKTNSEIGYVIIDVDKQYDQQVLLLLKRIPQTIRLRVLY